ncbi:MAG: cytochrome b [Planctomycetota bacterium]|jgi:cytochrome b6
MNAEKSSGSAVRWLDERLGLSLLRDLATKKTVPRHKHSIWYYLGGMTLFLFVVQALTGILLTLYYRPSPDEAYESVRYITGEVSFGWLIRAIHGWTANLIILVALVHLASVFFLAAYRKPRELTWITGALLLMVFLAFGFSGYLLPWNQLSFFATRVGTEIPSSVPFLGEFLVSLFRGGEDVTGATLSRFYGLHIAILPGITTILLGLHLYVVQKHGMSVPIGVEKALGGKPPAAIPFVPNFLLRDLVGWLAMLGLLAGLAALLPEGDGFFVKLELGEKADPFGATPAGLKPEWYFLAMFFSLKLLPGHILGLEGEQVGVLLFAILGLLFLLVPFLDRKASRGERRVVLPAVGVIAFVWLVVFTVLGRVLD